MMAPKHGMLIVGIIAAVLALGCQSPAAALPWSTLISLTRGRGSDAAGETWISSTPDTLEFHGNTGAIVYGAVVCKANTITHAAVTLLNEWESLLYRMKQWEQDGVMRMTQEEADRGAYLNDSGICIRLGTYYNIIIKEEVNQYMLFQFDPQYGFGDQTYILNRSGFFTNGRILKGVYVEQLVESGFEDNGPSV